MRERHRAEDQPVVDGAIGAGEVAAEVGAEIAVEGGIEAASVVGDALGVVGEAAAAAGELALSAIAEVVGSIG